MPISKALTYDFNFKFFKNAHDGTGDPNAPVGLRARIDDAASANKFGVRPENKIDCLGAAADISQAGLTAKTGGAFFEMLDLLLWSVDSPDGSGVVLYMNDYVKPRINSVIKFMGTSGGFDVSQDQFGRTFSQYKGATIRDPGVKADQTTRIIAGNAIAAGSGSVGETAAGVDSNGRLCQLHQHLRRQLWHRPLLRLANGHAQCAGYGLDLQRRDLPHTDRLGGWADFTPRNG